MAKILWAILIIGKCACAVAGDLNLIKHYNEKIKAARENAWLEKQRALREGKENEIVQLPNAAMRYTL